MVADETTNKTVHLGVPGLQNRSIYKVLESFFKQHGYRVEDLNRGKNIKGHDEIAIYLHEVNYWTLAVPQFGTSGSERSCFQIINDRTKRRAKICLITAQTKEGFFDRITISVTGLHEYITKTLIPTPFDNLTTISSIFSDLGHHVESIEGFPKGYEKDFLEYENQKKEADKNKSYKTVLLIDDFLCSPTNTVGLFFMENLRKLGSIQGINFLFAYTPKQFFEFINKFYIDTVLVDLDYSEWLKSKDSYAPENTKFFSAGFELVGWEIIRHLLRDCFKGWVTGSKDDRINENEPSDDTYPIFELLPNIYIFSNYELRNNQGKISYGKQHHTPSGFSFSEDGWVYCDEFENKDVKIRILEKRDLLQKLEDCNRERKQGKFPTPRLWDGQFLIYLRELIKKHEGGQAPIYIKFKSDEERKIAQMGTEDDYSVSLQISSYGMGSRDAIQMRIMKAIREYAGYYKEHSKIIEDPKTTFTGITPYEIDSNEDSDTTSKENTLDETENDGKQQDTGSENEETPPINFLGLQFDNRILLASTPITGIQVDDTETAKKWYTQKLKFLLNTGVGGIILKTSCYNIQDHRIEHELENNEADNSCGAETQETKKNQTRVYYKKLKDPNKKNITKEDNRVPYLNDTLYNTGHTAKENMSFDALCTFLTEFQHSCPDDICKIIPSVASDSDLYLIWKSIFERMKLIQNNSKETWYPIWEVNARYTIRGMLSKEDLAGILDEYIIYGRDLNYFYSKFESWIKMINELAILYNTKLLIKLPFRSDLLNLIKICEKYSVDKHYGVKGLTLINTVKAPYPLKKKAYDCDYDPAYIHLDKDYFGLPQMSGKGLKYLRDWALFQAFRYLSNKMQKKKNKYLEGFDISASGGIMGFDDIESCLSMGAKTVQIGTKALLEGPSAIKKIVQFGKNYRVMAENEPENTKKFEPRCAVVDENKCIRCGKCMRSFYCDAFVNRTYHIQRKKVLKALCENDTIVVPPNKLAPEIVKEL